MEERRVYPRYSVGDDMYCEMINPQGTSYYGRIEDISRYGARVGVSGVREYEPVNVKSGDQVYIYGYRTEANPDGARIPARAVWSDNYTYGIQFYASVYTSAESLMSMYPKAVPVIIE